MLQYQVERGFKRRQKRFHADQFHERKSYGGGVVKKSDVMTSLKEFRFLSLENLDIQEPLAQSLEILDDCKELSLHEFTEIFETDCLLDMWAHGFPLSQMLSDAIPRKDGVSI